MTQKLGKQVCDVLLQMWMEEEEGQCHEHRWRCDEFIAQEWGGHKLT